MDKPEALRLADALTEDHPYPLDIKQAAAELRRLHAENETLQNTKHYEAPPGFVLNPDYLVPELRAQRDALLEALNSFMYEFGDKANSATVQKARAAIKAVEGEKNHG